MSKSELRTIDELIFDYMKFGLGWAESEGALGSGEAEKIVNKARQDLREWVKSLLPEKKDDSDPNNNLNAQEVGEIFGWNQVIDQILEALEGTL